MTQDSAANRTLTVEKILSAPRALAWDAWTQADHIEGWYGGPGNTTVKELEFKVGGKWSFEMTMPGGGPAFNFYGVYQEIIDQEKVVCSAQFPPMSTNLVLVAEFEDMGDKTKFTFSIIHETEEHRKQQEEMGVLQGWGKGFEAFDQYLQGLA